MRTRFLGLLTICFVVVASACSSKTSSLPNQSDSGPSPDDASADAGTDASPAPATHTVSVTNFAYTPAELSIRVGDTVEWVWGSGTHTVSSGVDCVVDKKLESGEHSAPFTFRHTFTEPGTMNYLCDYMEHCAKGQHGVIVVTAE